MDARVEVEAVVGARMAAVAALGLEARVAVVSRRFAREADERAVAQGESLASLQAVGLVIRCSLVSVVEVAVAA